MVGYMFVCRGNNSYRINHLLFSHLYLEKQKKFSKGKFPTHSQECRVMFNMALIFKHYLKPVLEVYMGDIISNPLLSKSKIPKENEH